mgnify:CR=1 FL=1
MFIYEKKLQYPVRIKNTNPALAKFIISQYSLDSYAGLAERCIGTYAAASGAFSGNDPNL